jgi:hypothetical protein
MNLFIMMAATILLGLVVLEMEHRRPAVASNPEQRVSPMEKDLT